MNLKLPFGLQLISSAKPSGRSNLLSRLLPQFSYGRELLPESDYFSLLRAYRSWVYVCASKNATSVAKVPLKLYIARPPEEEKKEYRVATKIISTEKRNYLENDFGLSKLQKIKKAVQIEEVLEHPFLTLMENINNFMNNFYLWELTELYQELCGNAYWYLVRDNLGVVREIWPMPPQHMRIIPDKEVFIRGYNFALFYMGGLQRQTVFEPNEIVHFKFPSPLSLYYGKSPLSAVTNAYNTQENIGIYENALFANMGMLEGAFETDDELGDQEFERLKEEIRQMFSGVKNVGKSPLLEKGVKFKSYGFSPREIGFLKGREKVKEEICNAYGQSLGLWDKNATRANAEVSEYTYQSSAIKPRLIRIAEKVNEQVMPNYDEKLFVAYDDNVPETKEARLKEIETHLRSGYSNINQERKIDNLPPVEWGEKPIIALNLAPLGQSPMQQLGEELKPINEEEAMEFSDMVIRQVSKRLENKNNTFFDMVITN